MLTRFVYLFVCLLVCVGFLIIIIIPVYSTNAEMVTVLQENARLGRQILLGQHFCVPLMFFAPCFTPFKENFRLLIFSTLPEMITFLWSWNLRINLVINIIFFPVTMEPYNCEFRSKQNIKMYTYQQDRCNVKLYTR